MRWTVQDREGGGFAVVRDDGSEVAQVGTFQEARTAITTDARGQLAQAPADAPSAGRVRMLAVPEGTETSDGRLIDEGALDPRPMPLPLMLQTTTDVGHFGAELSGRLDAFTREGNDVVLTGDLDDSDAGRRFREILDQHGRYGLSVDLGRMDVEFECRETDEDGWCVDELLRVTAGELIGATGTPFPAFAEAYIELEGAQPPAEGEIETPEDEAAVRRQTAHHPGRWSQGDNRAAASFIMQTTGEQRVEVRREPHAQVSAVAAAAAIPVDPPVSYFQHHGRTPEETGSVSIGDEHEEPGRVYGYLATWDRCHVGVDGACLPPPRSLTDYAYFRHGAVKPCDSDCDPIPTGVVFMGTDHPSTDPSVSMAAAYTHYADTGQAVADVVCGEDDYGIWYSGALRPGVTAEQVRELRGSSLSGDWRPGGGHPELVAALAVNAPGFPVPRSRAAMSLAASGAVEVRAMVAVGALPADETGELRRLREHDRRIRNLENIAEALGLRKQAITASAEQIGKAS